MEGTLSSQGVFGGVIQSGLNWKPAILYFSKDSLMRSLRWTWMLVVGVLAISACVEKKSETSSDDNSQQTQAIINGQLDNSRQAVVVVAGNGGLCSGTIVQTNPQSGVGWALTAAHCVSNTPEVVLLFLSKLSLEIP